MEDQSYRTIENLFASTDPDDLLRGLALVKAQARHASPEAAAALCELLLPLFYIDILDHTEHAPVLEEAIAVAAGLGRPAIPALIQGMEAGDLKAQMVMAQALGRMGAQVVDPLLQHYQSGCADPSCRAFLLFALGKVKSPTILKAAPAVVEAAASPDLELRDTATRAIGKFVESIPPGGLPEDLRATFIARLQTNLGDTSPSVRAKAVRSLGKLAKYGHLDAAQRAQLKIALDRTLGHDEHFEWDRAYIVRKEAREALGYV